VTVLAAVILAWAAWLAVPRSADPRLAAVLPRAPAGHRPPVSRDLVAWLGSGAAAVGAFVALPTPVNVVTAVIALLALPRVIGRLESRSDRRRSDNLARLAPVVADLLAATLSSGAPMRPALAAVSAAVADPARECLARVVAALDLGAAPDEAWASVRSEPALAALADAVVRSARTGAPLADVLTRLGDDLRRDRRAVVEVAARTAGVRAVVPLAACFLPAFLLVGVVPVVAALAGQLIGS
jgi:Flp pilus assembly protein TadB